jgi:large subunit ribosomal protein L7/L12
MAMRRAVGAVARAAVRHNEAGAAQGLCSVAGGEARRMVGGSLGGRGGSQYVVAQQQIQRSGAGVWHAWGASRGFADSADKVKDEDDADEPAVDPDDERVVDLDRVEFPNISSRVLRLADDVCGLTLLEVNDLSEILKKRLNIQEPVRYMGGGMPGGGGAGAAPAAAPAAAVAEQVEFAVKLESFDAAQKIKVIKEVRAITELGLKEAKDLVEGAPIVIKKDLKKEDAEALKDRLVKVGAVAVLE